MPKWTVLAAKLKHEASQKLELGVLEYVRQLASSLLSNTESNPYTILCSLLVVFPSSFLEEEVGVQTGFHVGNQNYFFDDHDPAIDDFESDSNLNFPSP